MDQLATLFADIRGSRDAKEARTPRDEEPFSQQQQQYENEGAAARATGDVKDGGGREDRRSRARGSSTREPSRSTLRDASWGVAGTSSRESRDYRDHGPAPPREPVRESRDSKDARDTARDARDSKDARDTKETRDAKDATAATHWQDMDASPPPYQEIADANVPRPVQHDHGAQQEESEDIPPPHPSGITPTERCVKDPISTPVDWVIHPSAPHFVICGRCYVDRIYDTQQWRREFVLWKPSTGLSLRCHLGAIPHMALRWSKVHTAEEFLGFLKIMQRKKVARPCPGHVFPCSPSSVTWYTTSSIPGLRICQECRQQLFGGTGFSKHFYSLSSSDPASSVPSICHGSFNHMQRMLDILLRDDDWDRFIERVKLRIQIPGCCSRRDIAAVGKHPERWYRYAPKSSSSSSSASKDRYICEACYFDHVYKTNMDNDWPLADTQSLHHNKPQCLASLRENLSPDTADVEYSRAEIMRLLHGMDRRCYAQGTVGVKWYTTPSSPWGYGVCEGCYQSKIKPQIGNDTTRYFKTKKDVGRRASFACWMNSYHPFYAQHQLLLKEALVLGDIERLETACAKLSRLPGCQQGGMGQGKNRRWWGWRSLRICAACVKGGSLTETPAGKRFELHGEKDPYHRFCDFYSMQLRDRFHHEDVGELLDFARKRLEAMA